MNEDLDDNENLCSTDDPFDCPCCGGNDETGDHEHWCCGEEHPI